jgi:hypothetical protein
VKFDDERLGRHIFILDLFMKVVCSISDDTSSYTSFQVCVVEALKPWRPTETSQTSVLSHASTDGAEQERIATVKTLGGTEVVIEGVIYDIKDFDHPGGESIMIFGRNDVTVPYTMIHPYHTSKHLEKMKRVGTVPDWSSE